MTLHGEHLDKPARSARILAKVQGIFYVVTGIWPLVHGHSFQLVSGFKVNFWIAQTVGLLLVAIGLVLWLAARAGRLTREIMLLALMSAAVLGGIDLYAPSQPGATPAYFLDAPGEFIFVAAWSWMLVRGKRAI